jgi:hypothetical protein
MSYLGEELTVDDCEIKALTAIPLPILEAEVELIESKWFDYRRLHPTKATYLFASKYELGLRDIYAKTIDYRKAGDLQAFNGKDPLETADVVSLWRARQSYDRIGVRYEFGLRFTFGRFADRGWSHFPRPNQLYGQELLLDIADAWKVECRARLQFAADPMFRNENFANLPEQVDYHSWLIKQIKSRDLIHWPLAIGSAVYTRRALLEERALVEFGRSAMERAKYLSTTY